MGKRVSLKFKRHLVSQIQKGVGYQSISGQFNDKTGKHLGRSTYSDWKVNSEKQYLSSWQSIKTGCFLKAWKDCSLYFGNKENNDDVDIDEGEILEEQINKMTIELNQLQLEAQEENEKEEENGDKKKNQETPEKPQIQSQITSFFNRK